jgi:hypothetical protein
MEAAYAAQQAENTTTSKHCQVDCDICGTILTAESLQSHLETQHDIFWSFVLTREIVAAHKPKVYAIGIYSCLVPLCAGQSSTSFNQCQHFLMGHPQDLVCIPAKGSQSVQSMQIENASGVSTSMGVTITQSCARENERESASMRLLCIPSKALNIRLRVTERSWRGWKFSSTWAGSLHTMMPTPRPCVTT